MSHDTPPAPSYVPQDLATLTKARTLHRPAAKSSIRPSMRGDTSMDYDRGSELPRSLSMMTPSKRIISPPPSSSMQDLDRTARPLSRRISSTSSAGDPALAQKDAEITALKTKLRHAEAEAEKLRSSKAPAKSLQDSAEFKELERQFAAQEALLNGYQRENERSVTELESLRKLKRDMEVHLQRLYGADWQDEIARTAGGPTGRLVTNSSPSLHTRSQSLTSPIRTMPLSPLAGNGGNALDSLAASKPALPAGVDAPQLLSHIEAVRALVVGMERRLLERAADLEARETAVRAEGKAALLVATA